MTSRVDPRWREFVERSDAMEAWEATQPGLIEHPLTVAQYVRGKHTGQQMVNPACLDPSHLAAILEYEAAEAAMDGEEYVRFRRALRELWRLMGDPQRRDVRGNRLYPYP